MSKKYNFRSYNTDFRLFTSNIIRAIFVLFISVLIFFCETKASAQTTGGVTKVVKIQVGQAIQLDVGEDISASIVANSEIADIYVLKNNSVYAVGKNTGKTNVLLSDIAGNVAFNITLMVSEQTDHMSEALQRMFPKNNLSIQKYGDAISIKGTVKYYFQKEEIIEAAETMFSDHTVLDHLDVTYSSVVQIESINFSVNRSALEKQGLTLNDIFRSKNDYLFQHMVRKNVIDIEDRSQVSGISGEEILLDTAINGGLSFWGIGDNGNVNLSLNVTQVEPDRIRVKVNAENPNSINSYTTDLLIDTNDYFLISDVIFNSTLKSSSYGLAIRITCHESHAGDRRSKSITFN